MNNKIEYVYGDLSDKQLQSFQESKCIAIDTEFNTTMLDSGLDLVGAVLWVVQIAHDDGSVLVVQLDAKVDPINLKTLLDDKKQLKLLHFARADKVVVFENLGVMMNPVFCTKIASRLLTPEEFAHSLKAIIFRYCNVNIDKDTEQQCSDWSKPLSTKQITYAGEDVIYLHKIFYKMEEELLNSDRSKIAYKCFDFLNTIIDADMTVMQNIDIFNHKNYRNSK
ncbi:MAG: ribonuclease D [Alphaproteobacteria bacterium]|nr:ribonuclease D [Alphaproteobacteria bacterium]MBL0717960.1 ribonuclease D [Alphaproteobacteria bacterium]